MRNADRIKNEMQKLIGRAKVFVGRRTGDRRMEMHGRNDQLRAALKNAGEHLKDAGARFGRLAKH
jgi:uncharacterized protein YjbJ (UPF0337 family)